MTEASVAVLGVAQETAGIIRGLRAHDPEVLDSLIERYQHQVMRYLLYLTGNPFEAEDLFQELWLRVLRSGSSFNGSSSFDVWLSTVARNLVIDLRRKRQVASLDTLRAAEEGGGYFEVAENAPSPFDCAHWRQAMATFNMAMDSLHEDQRKVLNLRFFEGLALTEIARATCAPLNTVKTRLYRGIGALRDRFQAVYPVSDLEHILVAVPLKSPVRRRLRANEQRNETGPTSVAVIDS